MTSNRPRMIVCDQLHANGPTLVRDPFHRDGWVYEEKVDGWRRSYTRTAYGCAWSAGTGATALGASPAWAAVGKLSARALVLDGEVAIYDEKLRSRFDCAPRTRCRRGRHAPDVHGLRLISPGRARAHPAATRSARAVGERPRR
jgi:hypothetical protein